MSYNNASFILPQAPYIKQGKICVLKPTDGNGDGTFSRNSIATRVNKDGIIKELAVNVPSIDYSDGACPSLLLEQQATNLITYSEDFSAYSKSDVFITPNNALSPNREFTATLLTEGNANDRHRIWLSLPNNDNSDYTYSLFVKNNIGSRNIRMSFESSLSGNKATVVFDTNGNIMESPNSVGGFTNVDAESKLIGDYWKLSISANSNVGGSIFPMTFLVDGFTDFYQGDGTSGVYIWGAQLEQGSTATSYMATNGSTATRLQDEADFTVPSGVTEIIETIDGVEQPPITTIPAIYQPRDKRLTKVIMN